MLNADQFYKAFLIIRKKGPKGKYQLIFSQRMLEPMPIPGIFFSCGIMRFGFRFTRKGHYLETPDQLADAFLEILYKRSKEKGYALSF